MTAPAVVLEPMRADRPNDAVRVIRDGVMLGTAFHNRQGWVSAIWDDVDDGSSCEVHESRDAALARVGGAK